MARVEKLPAVILALLAAALPVAAQDSIPPAPPLIVAFTGVDGTTVQLRLRAPGDDSMSGGRATRYEIRYSPNPMPDLLAFKAATLVAGVPAPAEPLSFQEIRCAGLAPDSRYSFRMMAVDEAENWSDLSNEVSGSTKDLVPPATSTLRLKAVGGSWVELEWTSTGDNGDQGRPAGYDLRYSTSSILTSADFNLATLVSDEPAPADPGTILSMKVEGLMGKVDYHFCLKTRDDAQPPNPSDLSPSLQVRTPDEVSPASIWTLGYSEVKRDHVRLTWLAPGDDGTEGGPAAKYRIRYSRGPIVDAASFRAASPVADPPLPGEPGADEEVEVPGLASGTLYFFTVVSADAVGNWSTLSNPVSVITEDDENHGGGDGCVQSAPVAAAGWTLFLLTGFGFLRFRA